MAVRVRLFCARSQARRLRSDRLGALGRPGLYGAVDAGLGGFGADPPAKQASQTGWSSSSFADAALGGAGRRGRRLDVLWPGATDLAALRLDGPGLGRVGGAMVDSRAGYGFDAEGVLAGRDIAYRIAWPSAFQRHARVAFAPGRLDHFRGSGLAAVVHAVCAGAGAGAHGRRKPARGRRSGLGGIDGGGRVDRQGAIGGKRSAQMAGDQRAVCLRAGLFDADCSEPEPHHADLGQYATGAYANQRRPGLAFEYADCAGGCGYQPELAPGRDRLSGRRRISILAGRYQSVLALSLLPQSPGALLPRRQPHAGDRSGAVAQAASVHRFRRGG